ncbi:MAG TPA: MarR family transcriptional regulator [Ktedonobacterales bacterium]|nr:MarR family transcriptional regulator [Ktedonobacterales bacterium]
MSFGAEETSVTQAVYDMLKKTFLLLDDYDRHFFASYGLSTRQFWALQHLDEQQGRSMVDLSRVLLTDKSNVTAIVDRLEQAALAQRTPDARDRRVFLITLTPEGRRLRDAVGKAHEARIRELISVVNGGHLYSLLEHLTRISATLEEHLEQINNPSLAIPG